MPSQTLLDETSLAVLVSSYKIILDSHLSLHPFQHEFVFPEHGGGTVLCFVLEKPHPSNASHHGINAQGFSVRLLQCMKAFGN